MDNNTTLKTKAEIKNDEMLKNLVLSTCVSCEQQLRLLQLRLISFEDLINGVSDTITTAQTEIARLKQKVKVKKDAKI